MSKILVLDLDETLISTLYASNEQHADQLFDLYSEYWTGEKYFLLDGIEWELTKPYWYVSFIRSWSKQLIEYFQLTLGIDNVCILSWGEHQYVLHAVKRLGLDISPKNIYTAEDIGCRIPKFENKNVVLVDNENYAYHKKGEKNKVDSLYGLEPKKFIQVPEFDVRYFREESDITLIQLIKKIEDAYET